MSTKPLQIGLVGFGKIARDQHVPAIAAMTDTELVAVASRNATMTGVNNYRTLLQMLGAKPALDTVILCQPPDVRFDAARAAIVAGKHVFLEKPPCSTVGDVDALVILAKQYGITLFASWHSRFAAAVPAAKNWVSRHTITAIEILWKEDIRQWHPGQDWILAPGGFGVFDPGINALSILTEIVNAPVHLVGATLLVPCNRHAPIAADLTMRTADGVPVSAAFDFLQTGPQHWTIVIKAGPHILRLEHGGSELSIDGVAQHIEPRAEYPAMYRHFVDLVRSGQSDVDTAPLKLARDALANGMKTPTVSFDF